VDKPIAAKSDLPDWLSDVDSQSVQPAEEWKNSIQEEPAPTQTEMAASVSQAENLPAWLQNADEEETAIINDDTPPWLHREKWEAEVLQQPMPTSPSDWHPIEAKQPPISTPAEPPKSFVPQSVPPPQPLLATQPVAPAAQQPLEQSDLPAKKKKPGLPVRKQPEGINVVVALNQAKGELDRGDIPAALAHYGKLIKKGKHLEETIRDLTESIYRYPVEVGIWQTLGDAYMRANRLKEALEAYNKAEELIR
jgi:tetratricopeptide (TPR) repeat protein